jgi:hypothetical protein
MPHIAGTLIGFSAFAFWAFYNHKIIPFCWHMKSI